jgi:glutamate 5-kinase
MKSQIPDFKRIVVKVGSNVITKSDGNLDTLRISKLVEEIFVLYKKGIEVILISSGAVAAGRNEMTPSKKTNVIAAKQVWAAIGQVKLISSYQYLFGKYGITAGQVLATKESFMDRLHYLNMRGCISAMLENKVLPIVNENDTISVNELMFTDNDELSGLICSLMDCDSLFILTNVDGIYNGTPDSPDSEIIREIYGDSVNVSKFIAPSGSSLGRGGMMTKYSTARKLADDGINVFIANGSRDTIISSIINGKEVPFTRFIANSERKTGVKKWISNSEAFSRGSVTVNSGAREALLGEKASSLLMIGITSVEGYFRKGDIITILDENGTAIGVGKSEFDSKKAEHSLHQKIRKPLIHYDYLVVNDKVSSSLTV